MKVYVLEARLKSQDDGSEDTWVILGTYSSEAKVQEAIDLAWENGAWCDFITTSSDLDDSSRYLQG